MSGVELNMNPFDAAVLGIIVLSALVAFFRGFIREVLSLGAWVGAAIITMYLFPHSDELLKSHMKNEHLAAGVSALGTYIAALIGISIINSIIFKYVKTGAEVGLLDNFLGLFFGLARGAFIVSLGFLLITKFTSEDNPPWWLKSSGTKPLLQQGADLIVSVAPEYLNDMEDLVKKQSAKPKPKSDSTDDGSGDGTGYKSIDQQDLNRLINSTTGTGTTRGQ